LVLHIYIKQKQENIVVLLTLYGGKLTSYRLVAKQIVDKICKVFSFKKKSQRGGK
jgi:glycerol-3-phosphate dehydrogenase